MATEPGHIQISEFSKEAIPQINWMMEDLFCQYGVAMPWFMLDFDFPDYSERPDWVSGYNFNLDWGEWGYWLTWFNYLLGLLFDEANLPRWQMADLSPGSWAMFNSKVSELYEGGTRTPAVYVSDHINDRIVILDLDLNLINYFSTGEGGGCNHLAGDATHLYIDGVGQIDKWLRASPYTYVDTEDVIGLDTLDIDDDYVYIFGTKSGDQIVQKYNKSDLSYVDEFDTGFTRTPCGIAVDDDYIYCAEATTAEDNLKKFSKIDYSEVASAKANGDDYAPFEGMDNDGTYLYFNAGPGAGDTIAIHKKSDLSNYKVITGITTYGEDVAVYGDYVYIADYTDDVVRKVEISSGDVVATFGEVGVSGSDQSHLNQPTGVAIYV